MNAGPDKARKKELARSWAERRRSQGVFAVRCPPSGQVWVASSPNLDTQQNGVWFMLKTGGHPNKEAQAAWNTHGAEAFVYEVLEEIDTEELTPLGVRDRLKARQAHWQEKLGAGKLVG